MCARYKERRNMAILSVRLSRNISFFFRAYILHGKNSLKWVRNNCNWRILEHLSLTKNRRCRSYPPDSRISKRYQKEQSRSAYKHASVTRDVPSAQLPTRSTAQHLNHRSSIGHICSYTTPSRDDRGFTCIFGGFISTYWPE